MRIVAKRTLKRFWLTHKDCEEQLKSWFNEVSKTNWNNPNELKKEYPSASILGDSRAVFNIKGNNYRLIVKINYAYKILWIRFVGTHLEYDRIDANKI